jgi:hypothetical protein
MPKVLQATSYEPMTNDEYRVAMAKLKMHPSDVSAWLHIHLRSAWRYDSGEAPVPMALARLVRHMVHHNLSPKQL